MTLSRVASEGGTRRPNDSLVGITREIHRRYWPADTLAHVIEAESQRYVHPLRIVVERVPAGGTIVDIGGGWGAFACACAKLGYKAITIDDERDPGFFDCRDARHRMPRDYGVEVVGRDVARDGVDYAEDSIDAFTSFHSIEHWHAGPKKAFQTMMRALKPGGLFLVAGPNSNDFAKRITVPLGLAEWSPFDEWYEQPVYRSHVHELTICDLRRIAADLSLVDVSIFGRNSSAFLTPRRLVRAICRPLDHLLRLRPSLCTEIYLCGRKPRT